MHEENEASNIVAVLANVQADNRMKPEIADTL